MYAAPLKDVLVLGLCLSACACGRLGYDGLAAGDGAPPGQTPDADPALDDSGVACGASTAGLLVYWTFDEGAGDTVFDSSGNGHDDSVSGHTWHPNGGTVGGAIEFEFGPSVQSQILRSVDDTISFATWLRYPGSQPQFFVNIMIHIDFSQNPREGWAIQTVADSLDMQLRLDTTVDQNQTERGFPNVLDGAWHHLAFVIESGTVVTYLDSVETQNDTYNVGAGLGSAGPFFIGADSGFVALYDDLRYYDRALGPAEVAGLFACGTP